VDAVLEIAALPAVVRARALEARQQRLERSGEGRGLFVTQSAKQWDPHGRQLQRREATHNVHPGRGQHDLLTSSVTHGTLAGNPAGCLHASNSMTQATRADPDEVGERACSQPMTWRLKECDEKDEVDVGHARVALSLPLQLGREQVAGESNGPPRSIAGRTQVLGHGIPFLDQARRARGIIELSTTLDPS
jgi:hypothetical protein